MKFDELPTLLEVLHTEDASEAARLFEEGEALQMLIDTNTARLDEVKVDLGLMQAKARSKGLRYQNWVFVERSTSGRRSLNKALLIENGVKPAVIANSMLAGKPGVRRELRDLNKPRKQHEEEED